MTDLNPDLSIVMPAYLEEENLRILLPRIIEVVKKLGIRSEILVVDTITPLDKTLEVCNSFQVRYIPRKGGNYFGDAVRTGIDEAHGERILFMDSDGSHPPEFIPDLYRHSDQYDLVVASRYVEGGHTENPISLIWMSRMLNFTYALFLGIRCKDVSNSFKIYRAPLLKSLKLYCQNFDIIEEILYKLFKTDRDLRIKEVPFTFKKRMFGNTKRNLITFMLTYLLTMIRLRFGK